MALVKVAELKGELEKKTDREVNLEFFKDEADAATLRSVDAVTCVNCSVKCVFLNSTPVLDGETPTLCPSCGESLTEAAE